MRTRGTLSPRHILTSITWCIKTDILFFFHYPKSGLFILILNKAPCSSWRLLQLVKTKLYSWLLSYSMISSLYHKTNTQTNFDTSTVHSLLFTIWPKLAQSYQTTIITNYMLLHVSTFKMSSSGISLCLAKITYRFSGLSKIKLLKYRMTNFNKMFITQYNQHFI